MDQPGIPVISEHHRLVDRKELVELRVGHAVRVFGIGLKAHQVDHVHKAHRQVREVLPYERSRRECLERRDVACTRITRSGSPMPVSLQSLLAHSQMPMPRVQCAIASSIERKLSAGCLPATITLT